MAPSPRIALLAALWALSFPAGGAVDADALAEDAPRVYTVQKGDTLWGIAKRFLEDPWLWEELWDQNPYVSNPDLIYPGDRLRLTVSDGKARISRRPVERLQPRQREAPVERLEAVRGVDPTMLVSVLDRFQLRPPRPEPGEAPAHLVAGERERALYASGDRVFVRVHGDSDVRRWYAAGSPEPVRDPESGRLLGYVVPRQGVVELRSVGPGTHKATITEAFTTLEAGMPLQPAGDETARLRLLPRPAPEVSGRLLRPAADRSLVGQGDLVVIDLGGWEGIEPGHVLAVSGPGRKAENPRNPGEPLALPGKRKGVVMVVRTTPEVSFALVMENGEGLEAGDRLASPR